METALLVVVVLCIATQLVWATNAVRYDASMPYSSSRDAAVIVQRYLSQGYKVDLAVASQSEGSIQGQFYIVGIEPYFVTEPINNKSHRFWFWGGDGDVRATYLADSAHHAVAVVVEEVNDDQDSRTEEARLRVLGYQRANTVCGQAYYPDEYAPFVCDAFYLPFGGQRRKP